ncbi:hypothetical protein V473_07235 [Sphingobium cupriresistens LL01]|uniref:Uncharacterized protein n=1 Tax=Sphingobium cupriresistens LL01 TaxID=1420583 RepID=A0A0J7Y4D0_9SPHN|nr:hypothetical protein V473_07235 [Sphingobium cupriresistens LL01]
MSGEIERAATGLDAQHLSVLDALAEGRRLGLASRNQDKIRRKLRERGLIAYCGNPKRWQISGDGLAVRATMKELQP